MSLLWGSSTTKFDEDVDKATSEALPSGADNIELNLEISDAIRSKSVQPKDAMRSIKRRVNHKNPNVQLLALSLADTAVKNGGDHFLVEIASREFLDNMVSIIKTPTCNQDVKQKMLRLIQNWAMVFESKPTLHYAGELYKQLQKEGFTFPPKDSTATSAAMIDSLAPPEWIDSDVCLRCRTPFSFTNRKHHCRSCGLVFDQQCSSKVLPLPHLGIDQPVRVCDSCFIKVGPKSKTTNGDLKKPVENHHRSSSTSKVPSHSHSHSNHHRSKSAREHADDDLQRAIQMSLEEAGMVHGPRRTDYVPETPSYEVSEPPLVEHSAGAVEDDDPDMRAAIEASLREANAPKASAPIVEEEPTDAYTHSPVQYEPAPSQLQPLPNYDLDDHESDAIMTFSQAVETAQARGAGADFMRHREVGDLYERTGDMRPKLARSLDDAGRREQILNDMNQKLSQAARLYDQLLTAQVSSSPARIQSPPVPNQSYASYTTQPFYTPPPLPQQQYAPAPISAPPQSEVYNQYAHYSAAPQTFEPGPSSTYTQPMNSAAPSSYYQAAPVPVQSPPPPVTNGWQPMSPPPLTSAPPAPTQEQQHPNQAVPSSPPLNPTLSSPPALQTQTQQPLALPQQQQQQPHQSIPQLYQPPYTPIPAFPSVPNDPLPIPQQHVEPQPPKEAMLISFD